MNEWKVTNYKLSLRLRELDVRQDKSEWVWLLRHDPIDGDTWELVPRSSFGRKMPEQPLMTWVAAYDGSELEVMLPDGCNAWKDVSLYWEDGTVCPWHCSMGYMHDEHGDTGANVRAMSLIWLLENGNVTADEVNGRLEK